MAAERKNNVLELWKAMSKAYDSLRKAQTKEISKYKLTAPQFGVLEVLQETGPQPLRRISESLYVTGANITCVIDNLEKEELVSRNFSKEDRRVILGDLTPKGRNIIQKIYPNFVESLQERSKTLSENEQKQLIKLLSKLAE